MSRNLLLVFTAAAAAACAQHVAPVVSPEVQPDNRVTFRFHDPNGKDVALAREGAERVPMVKGDDGVWTVTIGPLQPDIYGYSIVADGVSFIDPSNSLIKPNLLFPQSMVRIPGAGLPWEIADVPHGVLRHHYYKSAVVGDNRDYFVYTPPGYDPNGKTQYPTLYLLHGFSDDASGWTAVGRANVILDNLIAQGRVKPMVVVMPLGYGAPEVVSRVQSASNNADLHKRNYDNFRAALLKEVMPQVESAYRVKTDREARAITGLSMGGAESLLTGLNSLDTFAWIGSFSAGPPGADFAATFPGLDSNANAKIRLLWIACGTDDHLIGPNRHLREWLKSKGIVQTEIETPGAHTWMVWRRNLAAFAPLLFQSSGS